MKTWSVLEIIIIILSLILHFILNLKCPYNVSIIFAIVAYKHRSFLLLFAFSFGLNLYPIAARAD